MSRTKYILLRSIRNINTINSLRCRRYGWELRRGMRGLPRPSPYETPALQDTLSTKATLSASENCCFEKTKVFLIALVNRMLFSFIFAICDNDQQMSIEVKTKCFVTAA